MHKGISWMFVFRRTIRDFAEGSIRFDELAQWNSLSTQVTVTKTAVTSQERVSFHKVRHYVVVLNLMVIMLICSAQACLVSDVSEGDRTKLGGFVCKRPFCPFSAISQSMNDQGPLPPCHLVSARLVKTNRPIKRSFQSQAQESDDRPSAVNQEQMPLRSVHFG